MSRGMRVSCHLFDTFFLTILHDVCATHKFPARTDQERADRCQEFSLYGPLVLTNI